jgi:hypothetical protein
MKNILKNILNLSIICSAFLLTSCEAEKAAIKKSSIVEKSKSEISFSEFKRETGLNDFKTTVKIPKLNNLLARHADGSYELSDFDLETDLIKRLELEDKVTYSFRIYPKLIISTNSFYNLTVENKDGQWIQNIVELKPTLENFDELLSGYTQDISGNLSLVYTSNENALSINNNCYSVGIIGNNCTNSEISETCVSKKYSTFCFDSDNNVIIGEDAQIFNNDDNSEPDYSFILNTNNLKENLIKFAKDHVALNNQIIKLMETETNANFNNFPFSQLALSQSELEFKEAIANSGINKYSELGDLLLRQGQNNKDFWANNKDFEVLKHETKLALISDAFDVAIRENPIELPPIPEQTILARGCVEQYIVDRQRCVRNNNLNAIGVGAAALGGPVSLGLACLAAMAISKACFDDAREDFYACCSN